MKNLPVIPFLIILSGIFALPGCNQFESFTNFTIKYEQDVKVESSTGINLPFNIATPQTETNAESEFENNDTEKKYIKSISLDSLVLTLFDPQGEDFSFLEEISIYINAEGLSEHEIAWKRPVQESASNVLNLDVTDADLQAYIKKDKFSLRLKVVTDELITRDYYFRIRSAYGVSAQLRE
ncbi:MAG: hypothetical protein ACI8SE_002104 [Bacteroidia bacterium]|jgi:hypothetical protein